MSITVQQLVEMPHLRLTVLSDGGDLGGAVTWTHTSDIPEPWRWVSGGELLMTNGLCVPDDRAGQFELIEKLADRGVAGLAIGAEMHCPPIHPDLLVRSVAVGVPLLSVAYPMPFVAISRAVAEATLLEQSQRLIRTERVYRALQRTASDKSGLKSLTKDLSRELGSDIHLCDRISGSSWFGGDNPTESVKRAVMDDGSRLRSGAMGVHVEEGIRVLTVNIPTHQDAVLACVPTSEHAPDAVLLQHAATVCALGLSQTRLLIEHDRRTGAELLAQIVDGALTNESVERQLLAFGLDPADMLIVAIRSDLPDSLRSVHVRLWRDDVQHASLHRSGNMLTLIAESSLPALSSVVTDLGGRLGVSNPVRRANRLGDAEREALWALDVATSRSQLTMRYDDAVPAIGPRSRDEAIAFVGKTLQPLMERPADERNELVDTLWMFLELSRSWQRTADHMHLHRQTVRYRIAKIEKLLGLDLRNTADLTTAWIAITTFRRLNI